MKVVFFPQLTAVTCFLAHTAFDVSFGLDLHSLICGNSLWVELGFVNYKNVRNRSSHRAEFSQTGLCSHVSRSVRSSLRRSRGLGPAVPGWETPPVLRDTPPVATQGGHSLACDAATDQASDLRPPAQSGVDLSCLTSDPLLGCQNHPLFPTAGRDVSAASSSKLFILLLFPLMWTTRGCQGQTGIGRAAGALTWMWTFDLKPLWLSTLIWLLKGRGWGHYSLHLLLNIECPAQSSQG